MAGTCWCGRSESGVCVGLHRFSEEEYQAFLKEKKPFSEETLQEVKQQTQQDEKKSDMPQIYTEERVNEIIKNFQNLLMEADNFPRDKNPNDYRPFWTGLRGAGSSLLGLTNHLKTIIDHQQKEKSK